MKIVEFDDLTFYATQQAHPTLFKAIAGTTPAEFCRTKAKAFKQNDELSWELIPSETSDAMFIATIPSQQEIEEHAHDDPADDPHPRYPWLNSGPFEIEPYELCQRLMDENCDAVAIPIETFPYCGALVEYGTFFRDNEVQLIVGEGLSPVAEVCRLVIAEAVPARIAIGFALVDDVLWVPHVWLVDERGAIHETCDRPFTNYYGVVLSEAGSAAFTRYYYPRRAGSQTLHLRRWTESSREPWWCE